LKKLFLIGFLCIALLPATAFSQKRRGTTRSSRPAPAANTNAAVHDGANQVAEQIKNLTRFIYLLGGVAKGIEQADGAIKRKEASAAIIESTERSKATVRTSLQNVRAGLDKLEIYFRVTPGMGNYYIKLAGVAEGAATAEQQAAAGQIDQAGRTLLAVVNRLTDTLLEMSK
jgi:hypothetical protein